MNSDPLSDDSLLTLRDASNQLSARAGEIILLCGDVGTGKTVWLKRLAGLTAMPANYSASIAGKQPGKELGKTLMLFDRQPPLWLGQNVAEELSFGLKKQPATEELTAALAAWDLSAVSLTAELSRLNRLQAIRLSLAAISLAEAELIILDNPTDTLPEADALTLRDDIATWAERTKTTVVVACNRWHDWRPVASQRWQITSTEALPQQGEQA